MSNTFDHVLKLPTREVGAARISHFEMSRTDEMFSAMRDGWAWCPAGKYVRLVVEGKLVMSNTRMEVITNTEVVHKANGKVLIAGLGLGMILKPILEKDSVTSVLVIEKHPDVIRLIAPFYKHPKLKVVQADIFEWQPGSEKFDTLYFDIWSDMVEDNLPQIAKLHQRFKYAKNRANPDAWMGSWAQGMLRSQRQGRGGW